MLSYFFLLISTYIPTAMQINIKNLHVHTNIAINIIVQSQPELGHYILASLPLAIPAMLASYVRDQRES